MRNERGSMAMKLATIAAIQIALFVPRPCTNLNERNSGFLACGNLPLRRVLSATAI